MALTKSLLTGTACAVLICGPAGAASDGLAGTSSTGTSEVSLNIDVRETVLIRAVTDFSADYTTDDFSGGASAINATAAACIFSTAESGFSLSASGLNDNIGTVERPHAVKHAPKDGGEVTRVRYNLVGGLGVGNDTTQLTSVAASFTDLSEISDADCSGGTGGRNFFMRLIFNNADGEPDSIKSYITNNDLQGSGIRSLTDTLSLVVEPNL